ncbi:MAG: transposase [Clostridiales bacterium]|nr:transposase [Clostridiales bacterium]
MTRKTYDVEFKERLIKESLETGNASLIARKHSVHPSTVTRWVREGKKQPYKALQKNVLSSYQSLSQEPIELESALNQINQLKSIVGKKELEIAVLTDLLKKTDAP